MYTTALSKAFDELTDLRLFVRLSERGMAVALTATDVVRLLREADEALGNPARSSEEDAEVEEQARELEAFARKQAPDGFPYMFGLATIQLWSILESLVDALALEGLRNPSACKDTALIRSVKGPLLEFATAGPDEQAAYLLAELKLLVRTSLKRGIGTFESLLGPIGLAGAIEDVVRKVLLELQQVRHVLVHRRGVADRAFVTSVPWYTKPVGTTVSVHQGMFAKYMMGVRLYGMSLECRALGCGDAEYPKAQTRAKFLELIQKFDDTFSWDWPRCTHHAPSS